MFVFGVTFVFVVGCWVVRLELLPVVALRGCLVWLFVGCLLLVVAVRWWSVGVVAVDGMFGVLSVVACRLSLVDRCCEGCLMVWESASDWLGAMVDLYVYCY